MIRPEDKQEAAKRMAENISEVTCIKASSVRFALGNYPHSHTGWPVCSWSPSSGRMCAPCKNVAPGDRNMVSVFIPLTWSLCWAQTECTARHMSVERVQLCHGCV